MTIKARGKGFEATLHHKSQRYRRTLGTREEAEVWEAQTRLALTQGQQVDVRRPVGAGSPTLRDAFDKTLELYWKNKRSESTAVRNSEQVMCRIGHDTPVALITTRTVDDLVCKLKAAGNSNATINRKLAALSKMLKCAIRQGWISAGPSIERQREGQGRIRYLSEDEERAVFAWFKQTGEQDMEDLVTVLIDTGVRLSEALNIKPTDVDNNCIRIWMNKGDNPRSLPMTERVRLVILRRAQGCLGTIFPNLTVFSAAKKWERCRNHLGLGHDHQFCLHALRHTCASRLVQRGISLVVVQEWLGHKSIVQTRRYAHLSSASLNQARLVLELGATG